MAKHVAGGYTPTVYYTNAPAPTTRRVICGVNCNCQKKRQAADRVVPGYDYMKFLGSGGFGAVHLYRHKKTHETVAIKCISYMSQNGENNLHEVAAEYDIVMNINHPNITKYYNFFTNSLFKKCYIVMEYSSRGALRKLINTKATKREWFDSSVILKIIHDIISGVNYLNYNQVVHCDLKPENILLGNDGLMKICDFGLARFDYDINAPIGGTTIYLAPELFQHNIRPNEKTEVWAIGIIYYELCNLCNPFESSTSTRQYVERARNLRIPSFNSYYSSEMKYLFQMMTELQPERRQTLSNLLETKIMRSF